MNEISADRDILDYDLTCWYLNNRRVLELIGMESIPMDMRRLEMLSNENHPLRELAIQATLKDSVMHWLNRMKPRTLGQLLLAGEAQPGRLFTHYDSYYFKGLPQISEALRKNMAMIPVAQAYAKLDSFEPGLKVKLRFHHEHLTSSSSWNELSGQRRLLILGAITHIVDNQIHAIPWVMADPLPDMFSQKSLIGSYWPHHLELHVDSIDSFSQVREIPYLRSIKDLQLLKNIPERDIKAAFAEILSEPSVPSDWGGEQSDLFSSHVRIDGERITTAFAFKGPARFHPMTLADLGKNGDQINRLFDEPAKLLVLQHCHQITPQVRKTMRAYAQRMGDLRLFCVIDGYDTLRILNAYRKCGLHND